MTFVLFFGYLHSYAAPGLGLDIYTRYLKYEHKPERRIAIRTPGDLLNYKEKKILILRDRLTPMLDRIKKIVDHSKKNGIQITSYNPNYKESFVNLEKLSEVSELIFPHNLVFSLKTKDHVDGLEYLTISFKTKPSAEQVKNLVFSFEQLFSLSLKAPELKHQGKLLSAEQKEMLQKIKKKDIHFMKYQTYYGVLFKNSTWVEAGYFNELKSKYEGQFAQVLRDFKYYFYKSKEIDIAIKSNILKNLEKAVESSNFENIEVPFEKKRLAENYFRIYKTKGDVKITFLFTRDKKSKSIRKAVSEVVQQVK